MSTTPTTTHRRPVRYGALAAGVAAAVALPVLIAAPAQAKGGSPAVQASGTCVGGGAWKLKAKLDDGRIQTEFEVDTNRVGQVWHVTITDQAVTIFNGSRRTAPPSGSFTVRTLSPNRAATDVIKAKATFGTHSCTGTVRI